MATTAPPVLVASLHERLLRIWETPTGPVRRARHGGPQDDRHALSRHRLRLPAAGRPRGGGDARAARAARTSTCSRPEAYNQLFSMHGDDDDLPVRRAGALGLQQLPLAAHARLARHGVPAAQRAARTGCSCSPGIFLYSSFLVGAGARRAAGSTTSPLYRARVPPGLNIDFYALGAALPGGLDDRRRDQLHRDAVQAPRAPGMSINRLPIFIWGTLTASVVNAVRAARAQRSPASCSDSTGASARTSSTPRAAASPLLWQHLFWMFGHPWVYIVVLPAMGIVSDALPTFCRRPLVGYTFVALATVVDRRCSASASGCTTCSPPGIPPMSLTFFSAASMVIVDPERGRRLRLAGHDLARAAGATVAVPVRAGLHRSLRDRRRVRRDDGRRAVRLAAHRHLLRRGAPALRARRDQRLSGVRAASTTGSRSSPAGC